MFTLHTKLNLRIYRTSDSKYKIEISTFTVCIILFALAFACIVTFLLFIFLQKDNSPYIPQESLSNFIMIPVKWRNAKNFRSDFTYSKFLATYNAGFQDSFPVNGDANVYSVTSKFYDRKGTMQTGLWVYPDNWPAKGTVTELEYPSVNLCAYVSEVYKHCVFGLDYHFRQQAWWYKQPVLQFFLTRMFSQIDPFTTKDTYVAAYRVPETKQIVLSNPCKTKDIVAYQSVGGTIPDHASIDVLCSDNQVFEGDMVLVPQWKTYNAGQFSFRYPPDWKLETSSTQNSITKVILTGSEGVIQLAYGNGIVSSCIQGYHSMIDAGTGWETDYCDPLTKDDKNALALKTKQMGIYGVNVTAVANEVNSSYNKNVILGIFSTFNIPH